LIFHHQQNPSSKKLAMINLLRSNKLLFLIFFSHIFFFNIFSSLAAVDIWEKKDKKKVENNKISEEQDITIESPIISEDINKIVIKIDENTIKDSEESVVGIFDPEENNFNLDMWLQSDGEDIKKVLKRIDKLKLSKLSENLLFKVLFTNAYAPKKNLSPEEFLKIKINWLIKKKKN